MIYVVLLYAVLASTFILAKNALAYAQPCFLIAFRMLVAGSLLISYSMLHDRRNLLIHRSDWWLFVRAALFHIYFAFVLEFWALQYVSALTTNLIYATTPFIAALLSYMLLKERLTKQKIIGISVGVGGLIPIFVLQSGGFAVQSDYGMLPPFVLLCAVVSASYAWFLVKRLMEKGYHLVLINGVAMLGGGLLALVTSFFVEGFANPVYAWGPFLFWVGCLIIVANGIVYNFYAWLLNRYSITFLGLAGFLCPSFGTLYEAMFMGCTITWHHLVCLIMVCFGLFIFYQDELLRVKI